MGKSSKTTQTTHNVTTPTNPAWVESGIQGLNDKISAYGNLDPYSLVAGPDALQTQAAQGAAGLGVRGYSQPQAPALNQFGFSTTKARPGMGSEGGPSAPAGPSMFDQLMGQSAPQVQAASLLDNLQGYMSPYTNDVVDTTLAGFDRNAGRTRAAQDLAIAGQGAFGGSGSALTKSLTEQGLAESRASAEAGLRDQAFNTGAGLSNLDAGRRQDASSQNAQLSLQDRLAKIQSLFDLNASNRTDAALQGDIGSQLQQISQARAQAPTNQLINQAGLFGSLPLNLLHGEISDGTSTSKTKTSDPMGALGSLAMLAAAPFTGGASLLGGLGALGGVAAGAGGLMSGLAGAGALARNAGAFASLGGAGS